MKDPVVLLYYKYIRIPRPKDIMIQQRAICRELGLKGRILIAPEGLNGTVEGEREATEKYIELMNQHELFSGIEYKKSTGTGAAFPKLIVRVRKEVVTSELGEEDVDPSKITGKYLTAEQLHEWFEKGESFKIVDMRNDYEHVVGHFQGSILPDMKNFRDLKQVTAKLTEIKNEKIVTVCTGGVRCEKASGYLVSKGFKDVYQLKDGIVTYMEKFPNQHFKGKLYVFDNRVVMGIGADQNTHEIIGKCEVCGTKNENYVNCADDECHKHFICCINCYKDGAPYCRTECYLKVKQNNAQKELQRVEV